MPKVTEGCLTNFDAMAAAVANLADSKLIVMFICCTIISPQSKIQIQHDVNVKKCLMCVVICFCCRVVYNLTLAMPLTKV